MISLFLIHFAAEINFRRLHKGGDRILREHCGKNRGYITGILYVNNGQIKEIHYYEKSGERDEY